MIATKYREDTAEKIARLAEISQQQAALKQESEKIKAYFEKLGQDELSDTKYKSVNFYGDENTCVTVGNSESVKVVSATLLKKIFGDAFSDFAKEEIAVKLSEPIKRVLAAIFQGDYIESDPDEVITQISSDPATLKTLKKKLKGNYDKDKTVIKTVAGLGESDAEYFAYMFAEAMVWFKWKQYMTAAGCKDIGAAIEMLKSAIIVDESLKVGIDTAA